MQCNEVPLSETDELIKSRIWRESDGKYRCSECDYHSNYRTNVKNHIEAHHMSGSVYECQSCVFQGTIDKVIQKQ